MTAHLTPRNVIGLQKIIDALDKTISVDPLQPNIGFRVPSVGGYHSRCSTAFGERDDDFFQIKPQQTKISLKTPTRCQHTKARATPTGPLTIQPLKSVKSITVSKSKMRDKNVLNSQKDPSRLLESVASQRERMQLETSAMGKTKMLKRLAQIVPHRQDQPYYMAGSCVKLSPRYQVDEEEIEKMRIQSALRTSRTTPRTSRASSRASATPDRKHKKSCDDENNEAKNEAEDGKSNEKADDSDDKEENEHENNNDSDGSKGEVLLKYKGNKIITTGNFAAQGSDKLSLFYGIDIDFSQDVFSDLSIVSKKQRKAFEDMFNDIDVDMNGKVTFTELMYRMFSNVSKQDAKLLMQIFDLNKDKTIDRREFIAICALNDRLCGFRTQSKYDSLRLDLQHLSKQLQLYKELFSMLDQDDDNKIHIDEVMLIMSSALGREIGMNENIAKSVMEAIDQDSKGFIDFVSYLQHIPYFLKLYKAMMESDAIQLQQLEEARQLIRDQLKISNPGRRFKS